MSLSQGQQRLVLFARAVVKPPQLLLLDEPTHGLDTANRRALLECVELVGESMRCSVVHCTHHREELGPSISHVLQLTEEGRVAHCGPV